MKRPLRTLLVLADADAEILLREAASADFEIIPQRVETAEATLHALSARDWDIVLCDPALPGFGAVEALAVLRQSAPSIPVIVVSDTSGEEAVVDALRAGASDFVVKRHPARLVPSIERALADTACYASEHEEKQRLQAQLMISDRMSSVGILAAGVAHEINNPLSAAIANLDLALHDVLELAPEGSSRLREVLDELNDARDAAERVRQIVLDLKVFSRVQDEKRQPVDVRRVLESCVRVAHEEIRHRARLVTNYAELPPVLANESRLAQVFLNLIVNAAQAIPEGQADRHEIRLTTRVDPDGRVVIEVQDTGSGMPTAVMKRLFTPFFTTKPIGAGTGLGLSLCHRIVESFGGEVGVESQVGEGSTFRVHLPAARPSPSERVPASRPQARLRRAAVLVVDDEEIVGTAIRRALARQHDVSTTTSAKQALDLLLGGAHFDIILCDLMMPHMTGMDLHAEIERTLPDQAKRMVFLTGGAFTSSAREFLDRVENTWMEKPFDVNALRALVQASVE